MEQKFSNNSIDLQVLREFCEREGEAVSYRKGDQMEREGDPARWFGYVTEGCFKYVTHGISDDREHITWFSFAGEFAGDYPNCLDGRPAQTTIEAMMPSRVLRVTGEQMLQMFRQNMQTMELRSVVAEHLLSLRPHLDLHRATAQRALRVAATSLSRHVHHLALQDLASFLCVTPNYLSTIRKDITFEAKK